MTSCSPALTVAAPPVLGTLVGLGEQPQLGQGAVLCPLLGTSQGGSAELDCEGPRCGPWRPL
jgi:hypothetical protein